MAFYQKAASDIFASGPGITAPAAKKCRVWLYYLRSGNAVEVSN
jgi:hypothetical protein